MNLLLDVHIAKATVSALHKIAPHIHVEHISHWRGSAFLRAEDDEILAACQGEKRLFLTYDMATIPDLLRRWMAEDRPHSGVIFADENTVRPNAPCEVASAMALLAAEIGSADMTNRVWFLRPVH